MRDLISVVTAFPLCAYVTREKDELNGKIAGDTVLLDSSSVLVVKEEKTFVGHLHRAVELLDEDGEELETPESDMMWMDEEDQKIWDVDPSDFWTILPKHPNRRVKGFLHE